MWTDQYAAALLARWPYFFLTVDHTLFLTRLYHIPAATMSRLSVSILLATVAIALVAAPTANASLSNPAGAEIKAFFDRYPNLRRQRSRY
jgi:hypothetical protein